MPFNGSGVFTRLYNFAVDAANGILIRADRMDNEINGIATGLSTCITKNGQTTPTANLPMGGFRHTNVGTATSRTHYLTYGQAMDGRPYYSASVSGTADAISIAYTIPYNALATGMLVRWVASDANTTAVTLNVDSLGAKSLTKSGAIPLVAGDIISGAVVEAVYDGTQFQLLTVTGVADGSITAAKLASDSVTTVKILDANVTTAKLADDAVTAAKVGDAELKAIAGLTSAADTVPYFTGLGTAALSAFTSVGRSLVAAASQAAQRTALGLGTAATANTGTSSGNVPLLGSGGAYLSQTITLNDDTATSFALPSSSTIVQAIVGCSAINTGNGIFITRSGNAPFVSGGTRFAGTTGVLSGTTGADTFVTLSTSGSNLYVENRSGFSNTITLTLFHNGI